MWIQIGLWSYSPLSSASSGLLMIDDFTSEETEGQFRAGSLFVKSSSPPQAVQAVSDSCIHENTVSGVD